MNAGRRDRPAVPDACATVTSRGQPPSWSELTLSVNDQLAACRSLTEGFEPATRRRDTGASAGGRLLGEGGDRGDRERWRGRTEGAEELGRGEVEDSAVAADQ